MNLMASLFFLLLSMSFAHAQRQSSTTTDAYARHIVSRFELTLGPNFIYVTGSDFMKQHRIGKWGLRGGISLIHTFNSHWELYAKFSYENKGCRTRLYSENPGPPPTDELVEDNTLNYITLTILPKYAVMADRKLIFGIGPYIGYLTTVKVDQKLYYQGEVVSRFRRRFDPDLFHKEFDFGLTVMVGSYLAVKKREVTIQFVYSRGLVDANDPSAGKFRNNTFSLLVGIPLKK
jgi:hypothetical protein